MNDRARELRQAGEEGGEDREEPNRRFTFGVYLYDAAADDEEGAETTNPTRGGEPDGD